MLNPRFTDLPEHMKALPLDHRGFPVPFFVARVDGEPFFPAMDPRKLALAVKRALCWVCGNPLGRFRASVIGPMCAINRIVSEPQSHLECARFSAKHCPFLANPNMRRVPEAKFTEKGTRIAPAGEHTDRNPGVVAVWIERAASSPVRVGDGVLFQLGDPVQVEWYALGREATRGEVQAAIESALPSLLEMADKHPPAERDITRRALFEGLKAIAPIVEKLPA